MRLPLRVQDEQHVYRRQKMHAPQRCTQLVFHRAYTTTTEEWKDHQICSFFFFFVLVWCIQVCLCCLMLFIIYLLRINIVLRRC